MASLGYIDLEGHVDRFFPLARAAEVLHFGQKATFGLGKVRCFAW
jgi:CRISPR/Cas system endoribonuclease Cas6 (RAMP superfamily)